MSDREGENEVSSKIVSVLTPVVEALRAKGHDHMGIMEVVLFFGTEEMSKEYGPGFVASRLDQIGASYDRAALGAESYAGRLKAVDPVLHAVSELRARGLGNTAISDALWRHAIDCAEHEMGVKQTALQLLRVAMAYAQKVGVKPVEGGQAPH